MAYEHKALRHKSDPKWIKNLNTYAEKAKKDDVDALIRNYSGDKNATMQAARYERPKDED